MPAIGSASFGGMLWYLPVSTRNCITLNRRKTVSDSNKSQRIRTRIVNRSFDFERASLALFKQLKLSATQSARLGLASEWKDPPRVRW
jgi:hypothetical protein